MLRNPALGKWWHPAHPDHVIPGMLKYSDAEGIELELTEALPWSNEYPSLIHGEADRTFFTLVDPMPFGSWWGNESWIATLLVEGQHRPWPYSGVRTLAFSMEGLQDWSHMSGVSTTMTSSANAYWETIDFRYERPDMVQFRVDEVSVSIASGYRFPMNRWGVKFVEDTSFLLSADSPKTIAQWHYEYVLPLQRLVQLATRRLGKIYSAGVAHVEDPEGPFTALRGLWIAKMDQLPEPGERDPQVLFTLPDLLETPDALQRWICLYRRLKRSVDTYMQDHYSGSRDIVRFDAFFSVARMIEQLKQAKGETHRFSDDTMAQLEAAVRSLVPSEELDDVLEELPKLRRRPAVDSMGRFVGARLDVLEALGIKGCDPAAIGRLFADTRNYEAHHNPERARRAARGNQLADLTAFCTLLAEIEMLSTVGIARDRIVERLGRDPRLFRSREFARQLASQE